jgi:hypothetical protein
MDLLRGLNKTLRALYLAISFQIPSQVPWKGGSGAREHANWVGEFKKKLTTDPCSGPPSTIEDHLMAYLEVSPHQVSDLMQQMT